MIVGLIDGGHRGELKVYVDNISDDSFELQRNRLSASGNEWGSYKFHNSRTFVRDQPWQRRVGSTGIIDITSFCRYFYTFNITLCRRTKLGIIFVIDYLREYQVIDCNFSY